MTRTQIRRRRTRTLSGVLSSLWLIGLFSLALCCQEAAAQGEKPVPCSEPEARQFDFRIGDWDVTMDDGGEARIHTVPILGGCVIEENYYDPSGSRSLSWARYVPASKEWKQIWVDSNGRWLPFTGGENDGEMEMTHRTLTGEPVYRMSWKGAGDDSFAWGFHTATGEEWAPALSAEYVRRDTPAEPYGDIPPVDGVKQANGAFGFWAGEWDLTWKGGAGTNIIKPILGGAVMHENFANSKGYLGQSITSWDANSELWRQVWVDNAGAYLEFSGTMLGEDRELILENNPRPNTVTRMRWHGVTGDSFTWTYESNIDDAAEWKTLWEIEYSRQVAD